jgi:hypothetical protein
MHHATLPQEHVLPDERNKAVAHAGGVILVALQFCAQSALLVHGAPRETENKERREREAEPGTKQEQRTPMQSLLAGSAVIVRHEVAQV